jgi:hypothetical protein
MPDTQVLWEQMCGRFPGLRDFPVPEAGDVRLQMIFTQLVHSACILSEHWSPSEKLDMGSWTPYLHALFTKLIDARLADRGDAYTIAYMLQPSKVDKRD